MTAIRRISPSEVAVSEFMPVANDLNWTALIKVMILGDGGEAQVEVVRLLLDA